MFITLAILAVTFIAIFATAAIVSPMDDATFQGKVIEGINAVDAEVKATKSKQETLLSDFSRLSGETKQAFEDLTKLKKTANDHQEAHDRFIKQFALIDARLKQEVRMAYGDPLRRVLADDDKRRAFNALIARTVLNTGERLPDWHRKALGEDTSPGSTLIIGQLSNEIYDVLETYGIWNTFAVKRVGTKTTTFPVKTARALATYILTEGTGEISDDSTKAGTSVDCTMEVIAALLNVSSQLLEDAEFDVAGDVLAEFGEALAYRMDWSCLAADGTADATDGGMTGIFPGGTAANAAAGNTSVAKTDLEDWINVLTTVSAAVLSRPCKWWMHPQIIAKSLLVRDTNKRPLFQTALEAPAYGGIGSILGYPVVPAHAAPSTDAASAKVAAFGDANGLVAGIRRDFTFEASDHHRWNYLQRSFRGHARFGCKIRAATAFGVLTLPAQ